MSKEESAEYLKKVKVPSQFGMFLPSFGLYKKREKMFLVDMLNDFSQEQVKKERERIYEEMEEQSAGVDVKIYTFKEQDLKQILKL